MTRLRFLAAVVLAIPGCVLLLLALPFALVSAGLMWPAERLVAAIERLTATPTPPSRKVAPGTLPAREAMLRQIDTLSEHGARPETIRLARQAVDTLYPPKVH